MRRLIIIPCKFNWSKITAPNYLSLLRFGNSWLRDLPNPTFFDWSSCDNSSNNLRRKKKILLELPQLMQQFWVTACQKGPNLKNPMHFVIWALLFYFTSSEPCELPNIWRYTQLESQVVSAMYSCILVYLERSECYGYNAIWWMIVFSHDF